MSTAARYNMLHSEMHRFESAEAPNTREVLSILVTRARLFRDALVALYTSAGLLAMAPIAGRLVKAVASESAGVDTVTGFTAIAILCLSVACVQLVRESIRSLHIIEEHERHLHSDTATKKEQPQL